MRRPAGERVDDALPAPLTRPQARVDSHTTGRWSFALGWSPRTGAPAVDPADAPTDTPASG